MSKRALIFGVGGQDGSYLAELLPEKGYEVWGTHRRSSVDNLVRVRSALGHVHLLRADLLDAVSLLQVLNEVRPLEVYNMADQDHVGWSEACPGYSVGVTAGGVQSILEVVRMMDPTIKVFQPISATVFGRRPVETPQTVDTPLRPDSPYACAKAHAWHLCRHYREKYGMFVACGVMYNHDSQRRGPDYLLQKIARGVPLGGDLSTVVDVGYAPEYVEAAWKMLQHPEPLDLLIGTGTPYTIDSLVKSVDETYPVPPVSRVHNDDRWLTPDVRGARYTIGWEAKSDARYVLRRLVAHHRKEAGDGEPERKRSTWVGNLGRPN